VNRRVAEWAQNVVLVVVLTIALVELAGMGYLDAGVTAAVLAWPLGLLMGVLRARTTEARSRR